MNKRAALVVIMMLFMTLALFSAALAETIDPYDSAINSGCLKKAVRTLFDQEKFGELEAIAKNFRVNKSRLNTGSSKLSLFYDAFIFDVRTSCKIKSDQDFQKIFQILDKWSKAFPGSITERVAEANVWISFAWVARGSGFSDEVTDQGWRMFDARINNAYTILSLKTDSKTGDCPQRFALLLRVGRAQGWDRERFEKVFSEGIALDPVYYPIFNEKSTYLLPRWHGEEGDWQRFAEEAVKLTQTSEGMSFYTRIAWDAWWVGDWKNFEESGVSWPKMKQGFLDLEKSYPGSDWNLNYFALFAILANDRQTASKLFERIGDKPDLECWKTRAYYEKYRRIANSNEEFRPPSIHGRQKKQLSHFKDVFYLCKTVFCAEPPAGLLAALCYYFYAFLA